LNFLCVHLVYTCALPHSLSIHANNIGDAMKVHQYMESSVFLRLLMYFCFFRHLATYDAAWQPLPVNFVLGYIAIVLLFGANFLWCWYWCTRQNRL